MNYTHELKIWGVFFNAVINGKKTFEIRKMDRDYKVGDYLHLREFNREAQKFTGREVRALITYIYASDDYLAPGYAVLGMKLCSDRPKSAELFEYAEDSQPGSMSREFIKEIINLNEKVEVDRHFRTHLMTELDSFRAKLNPQLQGDLDKILLKLEAKSGADI